MLRYATQTKRSTDPCHFYNRSLHDHYQSKKGRQLSHYNMKTKETRKILAKIDSITEGIEYTSSEKNNLFMALFDISMEHAKSIVILIENGKFGSAYALARPLIETFIRAAWVQNCATDVEVERFSQRDKINKELGVLISEVEESNKWPGVFSQIKENLYKNLNSYTHGGNQLTARRFKDEKLVHNPDVDEINVLLRLSVLVSFLCITSVSETAEINNAATIAKELNEEMKSEIFN